MDKKEIESMLVGIESLAREIRSCLEKDELDRAWEYTELLRSDAAYVKNAIEEEINVN